MKTMRRRVSTRNGRVSNEETSFSIDETPLSMDESDACRVNDDHNSPLSKCVHNSKTNIKPLLCGRHGRPLMLQIPADRINENDEDEADTRASQLNDHIAQCGCGQDTDSDTDDETEAKSQRQRHCKQLQQHQKMQQQKQIDQNKQNRCYVLLEYEDLPLWLRDNPFLRSRYRVNLGWRRSLDSLCHLHNETMNVWTHLVAFVCMLVILVVTLYTTSPFGADRLGLAVRLYDHPVNITAVDSLILPVSELQNDTRMEQISPRYDDEVLLRIERRLPSVEKLMSSLRESLLALEDYIEGEQDSIKQQGERAWESLLSTQQQFGNYVDQLEEGLVQISTSLRKATIGSLSGGTDAAASAFCGLRDRLVTKFDSLLNELALQSELDLVKVSRSILNDFYANIDQRSDALFFAYEPITMTQKMNDMLVRYTGLLPANSHFDGKSEQMHGLYEHLTRWPLVFYILTAMACLLFSSIFHLFNAVSKRIAVLTQCLDYSGICLLIAGSNTPVIYYGFYCYPEARIGYLFMTWLLGICGFLISVLPRFRDVQFRELKTMVFIALGGSGFIPLVHLQIHFGHVHFIFWYLVVMGIFYLLGAAIYLSQIPERYYPGKFDIWFSSHQLWHIAIIIAVLVLYTGLIHLYEWRFVNVCSPLKLT